MENFTKYYSYNQLIEDHDVLIMNQEQYLANKDNLDNPQQIVLVNRAGGPKEPKIPKWFQSHKDQTDTRFEKIENRLDQIESRLDKIEVKLDDSKPPKWFQQWTETVYEKCQPKWFTTYMESFEKKIDQKFKDFAKLNNLKYE